MLCHEEGKQINCTMIWYDTSLENRLWSTEPGPGDFCLCGVCVYNGAREKILAIECQQFDKGTAYSEKLSCTPKEFEENGLHLLHCMEKKLWYLGLAIGKNVIS